MKINHWVTLVAAVALAGINAWIAHGGSMPVVAGVPVLAAFVTVFALLQGPPQLSAPPGGDK